jgi:microcystin-dependent protein
MTDPFVAEIRIFGFNFAPNGWAFCNGQLIPISQNTALFSLLGTMYGGDGKSTFALPGLQGAAPMMHGQGPGLSGRIPGEEGGTESVTLLLSELPVHNHLLQASAQPGEESRPGPDRALARSVGASLYAAPGGPVQQMASAALPAAGGSLPHSNMMPYLTLNFCIALQGVFPPRG